MEVPIKDGPRPQLDPTAWVAPTAVVAGDIVVGAETGLWFGVVARADVNFIRIGARTNIQDLTISNDGSVQGVDNTGATQQLGQIQLARFVNKAGLEAIGDNLFLETDASGAAETGNPSDNGFGSLQQYFLEMSNVDAVTEISDLIAAQRAYEMNSQIIQAADEMYSTTTNLR